MLEERWIPSMVCQRWLHQARSIGSPTSTATCRGTLPTAHSTPEAAEGRCPRHCWRWHQCPDCPAGPPVDQGCPLPHKALGTEKHPRCVPPMLCQVELGAWSECGDLPSGHLCAPSLTGTMECLQHGPWCHSPESFYFGGRQNSSPKSFAGDPVGRCSGDPCSRTHWAAVTLQGYVPDSRRWICLGFTLCPPLCTGLAHLEKGPGPPRPAHTP